MAHPVPRPDATLFEILAARARRTSDGWLVIDVIVGVFIVIAAAVRPPPLWPIVISVGVCLMSYGLWGISDREFQERASRPPSLVSRALMAARVVCVAAGCMAALLVALGGLRILLGTWIS